MKPTSNGASVRAVPAQMADAQGPVTTTVDVAPFIDAKYAALGEHVTQLRARRLLPGADRRRLARADAGEDFTLRVSRVGVRLPEDDLFAGLR